MSNDTGNVALKGHCDKDIKDLIAVKRFSYRILEDAFSEHNRARTCWPCVKELRQMHLLI